MDGFFKTFGFSENPFASTNADKEPRLATYFVPPPYFSSVKGDSADPQSNVIFAPRGAGKTAQKVMLEEFAEGEYSQPVFCVTYDQFRSFNKARISQLGVDWHLTQIIQRLLAGIVALIEEGHGTNLDGSQKKVLNYCFQRYLGALTQAEANKVFSSVKSNKEKTGDFISKNKETLVGILAAIAAKWGISPPDIDSVHRELREESITDIFQRLIRIITSFGFSSVYILVDRVDEISELGNDADAASRFIVPLVTNLHLLECDDVAFKFFLWDRMEDFVSAAGFRPDRIPIYRLNWSPAELEDMLSRRLAAYSEGRITNLNDLVEVGVTLNIHKLICLLSIGSPRDVIRLAQRIVDEHTRVVDDGSPLTMRSIEAGIQKFSRERCMELYGSKTEEISKIGMVSFTIGDLANDIFRISHQAARNKIQNYMSVGAIFKSGEIENPGNRPLHQYSVADPRLAVLVLSSYSLEEVLSAVCFMCRRCDELLVREGPNVACHECALEFGVGEEDTVLTHCQSTDAEPRLDL